MLANEFEITSPPPAPVPLPAAPAPVAEVPQPEPEPESTPAPAPSPLENVFAEDGGGGETSSDTDAGATSTESASLSSGVTGSIGQGLGALAGGVALGPIGAIVGAEVGKEIGKSLGTKDQTTTAAGQSPTAEQVGGLQADPSTMSLGPGGSFGNPPGTMSMSEPGLNTSGFDAANLGVGAADAGAMDASTEGGGFGGFDSGAIGGMDGGFGDDGAGVGDSGGDGGGDGGCYITEAVASTGAADNAPELETLRWFRDNVLTRTPQGQELIADYEQAAPAIVQAIAQRPDGGQILQGIMTGYIQPAVEAVRSGQFDEALRIYAEMATQVAELASEMTDDPELDRLLEEFAQEAAEVSHDGELASLATATGGELVFPGDAVANQPGSRLGRIFVGG